MTRMAAGETAATETWLAEAWAVSRESPSRPRKVGAVLALRDGTRIAACNTFPDGVRDVEERHSEAERLLYIEHAERNALFRAAREGRATAGATLVATLFPCPDCARAIVQCGVARLVTYAPHFDDYLWGASWRRSQVILSEGGVVIENLGPHPHGAMAGPGLPAA